MSFQNEKIEPKFKVGDIVRHSCKQAYGKVIQSFPDGSGGWSYYVNHSRFTWSVPEAGLRPKSDPKISLDKPGVTKPDFPKMPQDQ
jgi:hypothetical protein